MISALQKISGNAAVNAPSEVREMFIENPHSDFASIFATHPPIEKRIEALAKYAGGRIAQRLPRRRRRAWKVRGHALATTAATSARPVGLSFRGRDRPAAAALRAAA